MSRERLREICRALSTSLPPCGGGLGRAVAKRHAIHRVTPLPTMLRIVDLPHKGGGDDKWRRPS
jgi:hypothetical protein